MSAIHDLVIVSGGIAGLIHLHYARQGGLDVVLLEKADAVGGLWRDLPPWQDIQVCPADWTVEGVPIEGPMQAQVLANVEAWVSRFDLAPFLRLGCPVLEARREGDRWVLDVPGGRVEARHLVVATGGHNRPVVPEVRRAGASAREWHSSALRDPSVLAGQEVLVVGGGASAMDLLDLCFEHGAARVRWAYRDTRWFTPTLKPKAVAGSVRPFGQLQLQGLSVDEQSAALEVDLRGRYVKLGVEAILPTRPLDLRWDQVFPGRARMLASFARIERHRGTVEAIEGREVVLSDGARPTADVVLWGTGYATDLRYFANPAIAAIRDVRGMAARCVCVMRSVDEPDLYFAGVGLDGLGTTSMNLAVIARTIVSHVRGRARLDMEPTPHRLNHLDMVRHLAERDPESFAAGGGWDRIRELATSLPPDRPFPMP